MAADAGTRMQQEPPHHWSDSAGEYALLLGIAALACAFIPVIGDLITLPVALGAVALGFVGIRRHQHGRAWRAIVATLGIVLGAGALAVVALLFIATNQPG